MSRTVEGEFEELVPDELLCCPPKVKRQREKASEAVKMTNLFKTLADENRLKIIYALNDEGELCVCDLAGIINSSIQRASYHLRLLRGMGLCTSRKEGKISYYRLVDSELSKLVLSFMNTELPQ